MESGNRYRCCYGTLDRLTRHIMQWRQSKGFATGWSNVWEKLALLHTEISEATEAVRDISPADIENLACGREWCLCDVSRQARRHLGEELADVAIRLMDMAASLGYSLEDEIARKMAVNEVRPRRHGRQA